MKMYIFIYKFYSNKTVTLILKDNFYYKNFNLAK